MFLHFYVYSLYYVFLFIMFFVACLAFHRKRLRCSTTTALGSSPCHLHTPTSTSAWINPSRSTFEASPLPRGASAARQLRDCNLNEQSVP